MPTCSAIRRFRRSELDRQRANRLAHLTQVRDEPVLLAGMAVNELLYGPEHPYGRPMVAATPRRCEA